jgi:cytochrome c5
MKHALYAILIAASTAALSPVYAQTAASTPAASSASASTPAKKAVKKKIAKKAPASPVADEEENEPDVSGTKVVDYQCELGNKINIFTNNDDDKHIALKWGKRLHRMARIDTSTGANRFENRHFGLVWIGIPAKGMLLDSKNGHQLANECKTDEQRAAQASTPPKA